MQAVSVRPQRCPAASCGDSRRTKGALGENWLAVVSFLETCEAHAGDSSSLAAACTHLARILGDEAAWREALLEQQRRACGGCLRFEGTWRRSYLCVHRQGCPGRGAAKPRWSARWALQPSLPKASWAEVLQRRKWLEGEVPILSPEKPYLLDAKALLPQYFAAWPGAWQLPRLRRRFARRRFSVALPGAGEVFRMELCHFLRYASSGAGAGDALPPRWDAEPLYLFDPLPPMALRPLRQLRLCAQPDLAREVPSLAERVAEVTRGWLLIGGSGSGSRFHTDAFGCGAWNVTLLGAKRWAMYPPGARPPGVLDLGPERFAAPAPIFWFSEVLPQLRKDQLPLELVTRKGVRIERGRHGEHANVREQP